LLSIRKAGLKFYQKIPYMPERTLLAGIHAANEGASIRF
jgi:hypothetical protein